MSKGKPPPWFYQQAAVIACRGRGDTLEIVLVTSRRGTRWVLPKGVIDPGEVAREAAAREALEEAGVAGTLRPSVYGDYTYRKWGDTCHVDVFLLEVREELDEWPESGTRTRRWLTPEAAAELVREPRLRELLAALRDHLDGDARSASS